MKPKKLFVSVKAEANPLAVVEPVEMTSDFAEVAVLGSRLSTYYQPIGHRLGCLLRYFQLESGIVRVILRR